MLMIRLQRVGRKNDPSFRVVVMQKQKDSQSGKFIEILGSYNARHGVPVLNAERIKYWMSVGAQVSPTMHNLLISQKIITGKKINVLPKKSVPVKTEETKVEAKVAEKIEPMAVTDEIKAEEKVEEKAAEAVAEVVA